MIRLSDDVSIIYTVQFNEGYQINVIYPFVVFMIRDFGFSEESVGLYAGLLTATFAICQFISSYFWGLISDKYGRKAALLIGSLVSAFAIIMFGTSTGYVQAVSARSLAGIFNGNIGVARAYVADITNGSNRGFAFSIFAIAFSAGIIAGSICGGALIETFELDDDGGHRESVGVIKWWIFDEEFPYLAPCVVGMMISFVSMTMTALYVQDTGKSGGGSGGGSTSSLTTKSVKNGHNEHTANTTTTIPMMEPNKNYQNGASSSSTRHKYTSSKSLPTFTSTGGAGNETNGHSLEITAITRPSTKSSGFSNSLNPYRDETNQNMLLEASLVDSNAMGTNALYEGTKSLSFFKGEQSKLLDDERDKFNDDDDHNHNDSDSVMNPNIDSLSSLFMKTQIVHALVPHATIMFMLVAWNAMVPLLLAQTLEMDSLAIGVYTAWNGVVLFSFTWFIQPYLMKVFNLRSLYITFGCAMLCVLIIFPSMTLIPGIVNWNIALLVAVMSVVGSSKFAFSTNLFVVSICFVNNSVPPKAVGRANGLTQAVGSGLRGLGPLLGGALWSWSIALDNQFAVYIAYVFMAIPTAISVMWVYCFLENDIAMTWTERHKKQEMEQ